MINYKNKLVFLITRCYIGYMEAIDMNTNLELELKALKDLKEQLSQAVDEQSGLANILDIKSRLDNVKSAVIESLLENDLRKAG
jgi:division protein CdvB (Snf7/Vps24/ESCRT-III family)